MESMKCNHCQHSNSEGSHYCSQCGYKLGSISEGLLISQELVDDKCSEMIEKVAMAIKKEVHDVEISAFERIQNKAINWAKLQLYAVGFAMAFVVGVLSYMGYDSYSDFSDILVAEANKVENQANKLVEKSKLTLDDLKKEQARLVDLKNELKNIEISEIKKKLDQLNSSIAEVKRMREEAREALDNIEKVKNTRFKISVHYMDNNRERRRDKIAQLKKRLSDEGYIVRDVDVANVSSNKQEIMYFHSTASENATQLQKLLSSLFPNLRTNKQTEINRDAEEIIIKLCANVQGVDNVCL